MERSELLASGKVGRYPLMTVDGEEFECERQMIKPRSEINPRYELAAQRRWVIKHLATGDPLLGQCGSRSATCRKFKECWTTGGLPTWSLRLSERV